MHILDEIIDKMVRQIFSRLRGIPKEQLITSRYAKETAERKNHLQALQAERDKAEKDLLALKTEILAVIKGESAFPKDTLAEMIAAQEKKHTELVSLCEEASAELDKNAELMANVSQLYEELISYTDNHIWAFPAHFATLCSVLPSGHPSFYKCSILFLTQKPSFR